MIENKRSRVLLVASYHSSDKLALCEEYLEELEQLAETYGVEVVEKISSFVRKISVATYLSKGKLDEAVERARELGVDFVILDDEITPAQQRNLEEAFGLPVMDRTELILKVFEQRAETKEARLQVRLAEVRYEAPRLKRMWTHLSRQAGSVGGAYTKGVGETQIEIDRRLLQKQIDKLEEELEEVRKTRETQRAARMRASIPTFAIVGYTNSGKSTLMNAITQADTFVENKLFATLDTTSRKFLLENNQEAILIDTVGFIRKLPHHLVAAFKSTLEEAVFADILLHVVDASHPMAEEHAKVTMEVLKELGAKDKQIIFVLNKIDQREGSRQKLKLLYPHTIEVSALHKTGLQELKELMVKELSKQRRLVVLRIPQSEYGHVSQILRKGHVHAQGYEENDIILQVDLPVSVVGQLERFILKSKV